MDRRDFLKLSSMAGTRLTAGSPLLKLAGSAQTQPPAFLDAHVHVFKRDAAFPYAEGSHPPAADASVEQLLALMQANNVGHAVLIQVIHYKWDNRYVAAALKKYPKRFQAVCRVNPEDPLAPDHLSQLTQDGFRGVRLSPAATADGDWIRGSLMGPLWRRCAELRVPMTLLLPPSRIVDIVPLLELHPDLTVVIDHMAGCTPDRPEFQQLLSLARYPKVFVKISELWALSKQEFPYRDLWDQLRRLRDAFGCERLIAATNWPVSAPLCPYGRAVELFRDHLPIFSGTERASVLSGTAQRIWPFS